jgi:hypothetical protein
MKKIRIDVGTSCNAPNSAYWLNKYSDLCVLGFEPNPKNIISLNTGIGTEKWNCIRIQLNNNSIYDNNNSKLCNINDNNNEFLLSECAIDDVEIPCKKKFFCTSDINTGCSSLHKPKENILKIPVEKEIEVDTFSLEYFFDNIFKKKYDYFEFLKTDTQSNDLNVLKSCGKYMSRICFIQSEYHTNGQYENEKSKSESLLSFDHFMEKNNFKRYWATSTDVRYVNLSLTNIIKNNNIIDDTYDFPNGLYTI